jgi:hypothetical protein
MQLEQFPEVDPVADEVARDRRLAGDERDRRMRDHPAIPDDRVETAAREHLHGSPMGPVRTDEVEHHVDPDAIRPLPHRIGDVGLLAEHLVRAELSRELPTPLVRVDPHDGRRAESPDELQRDVADASDADDGHRGAGVSRWRAASPRGTP